MRQFLVAVLTCAVVLIAPLGNRAAADTGSTGGAYHNPNAPALTPAELNVLAGKEAARLAGIASRSKGGVQPMSAGYVYTGLWEEPQDQPDSAVWCGPGSTTAVVSNFNTKPQDYPGGPTSYMTWLARTGVPGIGPMVVRPGGVPITYDTTLRDTVNNEIGQTFYFIKLGVGGTSNFASYLYADLSAYGHPVFSVVQANGLPGWIGFSAKHWQWTVSFDDGADYISYGDSAGPNATSGGQDPHGFHGAVGFAAYYNHIADPSVWDEIVW